MTIEFQKNTTNFKTRRTGVLEGSIRRQLPVNEWGQREREREILRNKLSLFLSIFDYVMNMVSCFYNTSYYLPEVIAEPITPLSTVRTKSLKVESLEIFS